MKEVTQNNFNDFASNGLVLIDFYATWCHPCKALEGALKAYEKTHGVPVGKVNVDVSKGIANAFGILAIPTVVALRDGREVHRASGVMPLSVLEEEFLKV